MKTAGQKAAATRKAQESKMTPLQLRKLHSKRVLAALKAWDTIRAKKEHEKRSLAAKKAWVTIRAKKSA